MRSAIQKHLAQLISLFGVTTCVFAGEGGVPLLWLTKVSNPLDVTPHRLAIDPDGNSYLAGSFSGTVLGLAGSSNADQTDGFLAKLDSTGTVVWVRAISGPLNDSVTSIAVSPTGDVYAGGSFGGPAAILPEGRLIPGGTASNWFIMKFDSAGNFQWESHLGRGFVTTSVACDADGNCFVSSKDSSRFNFKKFAPDGANRFDWDLPWEITSLSCDQSGNIYALSGGSIRKHNPSGTQVWEARLPSSINMAVADADGNCWFGGQLTGPFLWKGTLLSPSPERPHPFVLGRLDSSGTMQWVSIGGTNGGAVGIAPFGRNFFSLTYVGPTHHVTRFDPDGLGSTVLTWEGPPTLQCFGTDKESSVFIAGRTLADQAHIIDGQIVSSVGPSDAFVAKFSFSALGFLSQPGSFIVAPGSPVRFEVRAYGPSLITYQWRHEGVDIPGATSNSYYIPSAGYSDGGVYDVVIKSADLTAVSSAASLAVNLPPVINVLSPSPDSFWEAGPITVAIDATDPDNTVSKIQFTLTGTLAGFAAEIKGATLRTNFSVLIEGDYALMVSAIDALGGISSAAPQIIHVGKRPTFVAHPVSRTAPEHANVLFSATARSDRPISYSWFHNNALLPDETMPTLLVKNVTTKDQGTYKLRASNVYGESTSAEAELVVTNSLLPFVTISSNDVQLTDTNYHFNGSVRVTLQSTFPSALIFYTLDGSEPNYFSRFYAGEFEISRSSILRAVAYSADFFFSGEATPIEFSIVPSFALTATTSGGGLVTQDPLGTNFLQGTEVRLTATAAPGWIFLGWNGDSADTNGSVTLVMDRSRNLQAVFGTTLSASAAGNGTIIINPATLIYPYGARVSFSAIPEVGNHLFIWGGAGAGSHENPLNLFVTNAEAIVSALFLPTPAGELELSVVPHGGGSVTVTPPAGSYPSGARVTLKAIPNAGQSFDGWSGALSGTANPVTISVTASQRINAIFTQKPSFKVRISNSGEPIHAVRFSLDTPLGQVAQLEFSTDLPAWRAFRTVTNNFGVFEFDESAGSTPKGAVLYRVEFR